MIPVRGKRDAEVNDKLESIGGSPTVGKDENLLE